jgi:hypothetical protein
MKAKFKIGERVYVTEKCCGPFMNTANELYYVGQSKNGEHVLENEKGLIIHGIPAVWFRKSEDVTLPKINDGYLYRNGRFLEEDEDIEYVFDNEIVK